MSGAQMRRRKHKYGCRRCRDSVGNLGRMSDADFAAYLNEKSEDTYHKVQRRSEFLRRLTPEEYREGMNEERRPRYMLDALRAAKREESQK